jgi:hypothetical protein
LDTKNIFHVVSNTKENNSNKSHSHQTLQHTIHTSNTSSTNQNWTLVVLPALPRLRAVHRVAVSFAALNNSSQKKHFSLIEDLKNITSFLTCTDDFDFFLHWVPSHIENTSIGKLSIHGNVNADKLARFALQQKEPLHKNIAVVRREILIQSAQLIANIDKLLISNPHICTIGGPSDSSDDFSVTDAIRDTSFRVP